MANLFKYELNYALYIYFCCVTFCAFEVKMQTLLQNVIQLSEYLCEITMFEQKVQNISRINLRI